MRFIGMAWLQREGYTSLRLIFGTKQGRLKYLANQEKLSNVVSGFPNGRLIVIGPPMANQV
jgi:hypothetical protein